MAEDKRYNNINEEEAKKMVQSRESEEPSEEQQKQQADNVDEQVNETINKEGLASDENKEQPNNLGKASFVNQKEDDTNADMILGYHPLDFEEIPSKGLFYPSDLEVHIRAAGVEEIKHFSTLQEDDLYDVEDKMNHIMKMCTRFKSKMKPNFQWKDVLVEDRFAFILAIKELTFAYPENKLTLEATCPECQQKTNIELKRENLQFNQLDEQLAGYHSEEERALMIRTRSYGIIKMLPPNLGVQKVVTDYIRDKARKGEYYDKGFINIFPYIQHEWRGLDNKGIFRKESDFKMDMTNKPKLYQLYYNLAERLNVGIKSDLKAKCNNCGEAEVTTPISFPDGLKALFIISDISSELL